MKGWSVGTCSRCSATIYNAPYFSKSEDGEFCSKECRTGKQPERRGGRPRKFKCNAEKQQAYRRRALCMWLVAPTETGIHLTMNPDGSTTDWTGYE
jgi:hypothetical protein